MPDGSRRGPHSLRAVPTVGGEGARVPVPCAYYPPAGVLQCWPPPSLSRLRAQVREHTELAWLLACVTPLGWLQRMTQFKDKSAAPSAALPRRPAAGGSATEKVADQPAESAPAPASASSTSSTSPPAHAKKPSGGGPNAGVGLGLLAYPVLQAADILLYHATHVSAHPPMRQCGEEVWSSVCAPRV